MKDTPLISVLMPAYNVEEYIRDSINSILNQTFTNFEFIIIDDGSKDRTAEIIQSIEDPRIKFYQNEQNKGLSYNLNYGIHLATGKYIARMDSDDFSFPDRFQKQVDYMEAHPDISILGANYIRMDNDYEILHPQNHDLIKVTLLKETAFAHPTVMFRREDIVQKKLFFQEEYIPADDYKFWTDTAIAGLKFANLPEPLLAYRIHATQMSASLTRQLDNAKKIRIEYARRFSNNEFSENELAIIGNQMNDIPIYKKIQVLDKLKTINKTVQFFNQKAFDYFWGLHSFRFIKLKDYLKTIFSSKLSLDTKKWVQRGYFSQKRYYIKDRISKLFSPKFWSSVIYGKRLNSIIRLINKTVRQQQADPLSIPIIIINYNRLADLKRLVSSLLDHKHKKIVVVDNNSTYPPLLEYYKEIEDKVTIERLNQNYGHLVFWTNDQIYNKYSSGYYVITDSDINLNKNLPQDYMNRFMAILDNHKNVIKTGFALCIDDIPDYYIYKSEVLKKESEYWENPIGENMYLAAIDTTFALYPPKYRYGYGNFVPGIRLAGDFTARHGGWYIDKENMTEEEIFYFKTASRSNSWKIKI